MINQIGLDATLADLASEFLSFPSRICVLWSQTAKPQLLLSTSTVAVFPILFICWILECRSGLVWLFYPSSGNLETLLYALGGDSHRSVFPSFHQYGLTGFFSKEHFPCPCSLAVVPQSRAGFCLLAANDISTVSLLLLMPQVGRKVLLSCLLPWCIHGSWKFHDAW